MALFITEITEGMLSSILIAYNLFENSLWCIAGNCDTVK